MVGASGVLTGRTAPLGQSTGLPMQTGQGTRGNLRPQALTTLPDGVAVTLGRRKPFASAMG
jgi:hypothetical protein